MDSPMKTRTRIKLLPAMVLAALSLTGRVAQASGTTTITYTYDAGDNVATVVDPRGLVTTYTHDGLGQLWQQVSPDTGTTSFAYDTYGRKSSMTRADGAQTTYGFDGLNRPVSVSAGGLTQNFTYDTCTNGLGRLCADSDATGTTSYTYTPEGWVAGRGFSMGGTGYALSYGYEAEGHVASVTYPDNNQANYTYTNGVVSSVTLTVSGTQVSGATAITYQPMNMGMASWTSSNGLSNTMSYDSDARLTGISVPNVQSLGFTYDNGNRITQIGNGYNGSWTQYFGYDAMSRVLSVYSGSDNESYQYDANGNRLAQTTNGSSLTVNISATNNQVVSIGGATTSQYGYDAKGNLTTVSSVPTYQYSAFNRMTAAGSATYYVNPEDQRLSKLVAGTTSYFAPDQSGALLAETQNGAWSDYVWLNGWLIGRINGGQVVAIHDDQTGRPQAMTNSSQSIVWAAESLPFTQNVTQSSTPPLNLGFPGQYYDAESGNWNNGYRDYSSGLGRYVESDPAGLAGGINTYAYAFDDPLNFVDPFGLQTVAAQQREIAVQGATNVAAGVVLSDAAGAISDVGGELAGGAVAISSVQKSMANEDYNEQKGTGDPLDHLYPQFRGVVWRKLGQNFDQAWANYSKIMMQRKTCP